jgi:hypothetical protein
VNGKNRETRERRRCIMANGYDNMRVKRSQSLTV